MSTLENVSGVSAAVIRGKTNVWFGDKVVVAGVDIGVMLVSLGGRIGRLDGVKEIFTVLENNDIEDAVCVSTSAVDTVVFDGCFVRVPVTDVSVAVVDIIPATSELLNVVELLGVNPADDKDVGNVVVGDEKLASRGTP